MILDPSYSNKIKSQYDTRPLLLFLTPLFVQASLQESQSWQTAASRVNEAGFSFSADTSGALLDFMRSRHGENNVSGMLAEHNLGDTNATQLISNEAAEFAKSHGRQLAGVQDAPTASDVTSADQRNRQEVDSRTNEITETSQDNSASIHEKASRSGLPTSGDIREEALNIMYEPRKISCLRRIAQALGPAALPKNTRLTFG